MADCECLPRCIFFNDKMANAPATANIYKKRYCTGDNRDCARFMVFKVKGGPAVPADLFPNDRERAQQIIDAG